MLIGVADDVKTTRDFLEERLSRWGYDIERLETANAVLGRAEEDTPPRILLLRWRLTGMETADLCRALRERPKAPYTHVIAVVDRGDCHAALEAMTDDLIDDCLVLPIDAYGLEVRLVAARKSLTLHEGRERAEARLEAQSLKDGLTGLWSRGASVDFLRRELQRGSRDNSAVGAVLLTVRGLDAINQAGGHAGGDHVLRRVADSLRTAVRATDWLGRYSGAGFLVVLPGCSAARAESVAVRLARTVGASLDADAPAAQGELSYSATSSPADAGDDADALLSRLLHGAAASAGPSPQH